MNRDVRRGFLLTCGGLIAIGAGYLLYVARGVLLLLLAAVIVAQAIAPGVDMLRKRGLSLALALACIYSIIIIGCGALAWRLEETLGSDLSGGAAALGEVQQQIHAAAASSEPLLRGMFGGLERLISRLIEAGTATTPRQSVSEVRTAAAAAFSFLSVLVFSAYWLTEHQRIRSVVLALVPEPRRERAGRVWDDVAEQFGAWARGEIVLMLTIAVPFGLALELAGSHYPILLAMFAGIVGVIPVIGSILGPAPAVLLSLTQGLPQGLFVLAVGVLLQLVEGIIVGPRLMSRITGVSPFIVLCGIIVGAAVDGIAGAFVAVPLAAMGAVALRHSGLPFDLRRTPPKAPAPAEGADTATPSLSPVEPMPMPRQVPTGR